MKVVKQFFYVLIIISFIPIIISYAEASDNKTDNKTDNTTKNNFDVPPIITTLILTPIAGVIGYLLKQYFVNRDFVFQQKIEHHHWLLQQIHSFAEKYYTPMAKFAWDSLQTISISSTSKNKHDIVIAYDNLSMFLAKYLEFKRTVGANFLFRDRAYENPVIKKIQAILTAIPFDELDLDQIAIDVTKSNNKLTIFPHNHSAYKYFESWIKSEYCKKSRDLLITKLFELQDILDDQGERISSPDYFLNSKSKESIPTSSNDIFWILYANTKYVHPGDDLFVYGEGFDSNPKYDFILGNLSLNIVTKNKDYVQLKIPDKIDTGTYDLYARFASNGSTDETIGIVIHVG
ncbi:MAG: hypothetical protein WAL88_07540 [Nitrosotalea sp.]